VETSNYFCSSEWHFVRFKGKGAYYAGPIYSLSLRLSKKSGIFSASVPELADYFGADEKTIRKAIRLLGNTGFFNGVSHEPGASVRYRPIRHEEWAKIHPGRCTEKETMPWSNEPSDTLGVELHAISGQRFKPFPNFIRGMRKTHHSDAAIREHFRTFINQQIPIGRQWATGFAGNFIKYLKDQTILSSDPSQRLVGVVVPPGGTTQVPTVGT
jgi:hypothetical protein